MNATSRLAAAFLALGLATPLAFAQQTDAQDPQTDTTNNPTTTTGEQGTRAGDAGQPAPAGASQGQGTSWAALDADSDGNISKQESQRHAGLAAVFDQADADGNGQLTAEEYRGYVQKQQGDAEQE
ncbi:MAG TPA: EF-hand domain-containing protein [Pseudoxanthomonas sp.]|nr:EF-hand domain-containing protein [Pseudoxanthomonas sp.]